MKTRRIICVYHWRHAASSRSGTSGGGTKGRFSMKRTMRCGCFLFGLALLMLSPRGAVASYCEWAGGTGNWNDDNWGGTAPNAGDDVVIPSGTVNLTNTTPWLSSFTNSGTLIFTGDGGYGTNIALQATNVVVLSGGNITHMNVMTSSTNALGVWVPSNRVWIVCSNFYLATNANINVNGLGYKGNPSGPVGNGGPGAGPGGGLGGRQIDGNNPWRGGGGGYGGRGGDTDQTVLGFGRQASGGPEYGSSNAPVDAGSGGGAIGPNYGAGGSGGGAVCIQSAGAATIFGTISADGSNAGGSYAGGGSGGSIFLTCDSFAGSTNGLLRANGGNGSGPMGSGGGGGGRIAVIYGAGQIANPGVRFDTTSGTGTSPGYPGTIGTVYFPHTGILQQPIADGRLDSWLFKNVRLFIPGFTTWSSSSLTVSNCVVMFAEPGFTLNVPDTLTIAGSGSVAGLETGPHQLTCTNLYVNTSGSLALGTNWTVSCSNLAVVGSGVFTLGSNATLSGSTLALNTAGNLTLGANATLNFALPSVMVDAATFIVGANSTIAGFGGDVIAKNGANVSLGLQSVDLQCDQITVTNGGNLSLYLSSLTCSTIMASGTGAKDTGNIRLYYMPSVACSAISLTNGGTLGVWAAVTNWTGETYATLVNLQGNLTIGPNSWLYPWAYTVGDTGRTVYVQAANISIAAAGGIDADWKGYPSGWGPGKGVSTTRRGSGGGHGGRGGDSTTLVPFALGGSTNDSLTMPIDLGSSGGAVTHYTSGAGGGAVRVEASGTVTLDGAIKASGAPAGIRTWSGGGAGGTIYVRCRQFAGAATGNMTAKGGAGDSDGGGGGGGRIAVWWEEHIYAGTPTIISNGTSVDGGLGTVHPDGDGASGTVYWGLIPPRGTVISIR